MRSALWLLLIVLFGCSAGEMRIVPDSVASDAAADAGSPYGSIVAPRTFRAAVAIVDMEDIQTSDRVSDEGIQRALAETATYFRETTQARILLETAPQLFHVRVNSRYAADGHTIRDGDDRYLYDVIAPRIRAALAAVNVRTEDYDLFGYVMLTEHPWGGIAQANCNVMRGDHCQAFFDDTLENVRAYAHEFGHDFGLMHTTALRDDGSLHQYGDYTCVMGGSWCASSFAVPQLRSLGVLTERNIVSVGESDTEVDPNASYTWNVEIGPTTGDFSSSAIAAEVTVNLGQVPGRRVNSRRFVIAHRKARGVDANLTSTAFINTTPDAFERFQVYEDDHRHHHAGTPFSIDYEFSNATGRFGRRLLVTQLATVGERVRFRIEVTPR